ncbi:MAG TPA: hypothetical protein VF658_22020, partial [Pyrinomonadaceae bacterium]
MKDKKNTQPLSIYSSADADRERVEQAGDDLPIEQELKDLFNRWSVPETPPSLDNRLLSAYRQEFKRAPFWKQPFGARVPVQHPVPSREEVFMKQCPTCQEEFANKFSFCPVDGTPLNELAAAIVATPPPAEVSPTDVTLPAGEQHAVSAIPTYSNPDYHLTIIEDAGITRRLVGELRAVKQQSQLTWPDFKQDPAGFSRRLISG